MARSGAFGTVELGADIACGDGVAAGMIRRDELLKSRDVLGERAGAFEERGGRRSGANGVVCRGCLFEGVGAL
jgi:hypothetical protein